MLDNLVQKSLEHSAEKPGDYIKDGVLCCGACGKPKQKKIHFPNMGDRLVGIACDCTESEKASADDANDTAAFEMMTAQIRKSLKFAGSMSISGTRYRQKISASCFAALSARARAFLPAASQMNC